jgi:hypothetical protein
MIEVHTIEQRTMQQGSQPPVTIVREVIFQNGKGVKKIQVLRGDTLVSAESEKLNFTEQKNVHKRKFMKGLYKSMERKTMKNLNAPKKQVAATKKRTVEPKATRATKATKARKTKKARRQQRN